MSKIYFQAATMDQDYTWFQLDFGSKTCSKCSEPASFHSPLSKVIGEYEKSLALWKHGGMWFAILTPVQSGVQDGSGRPMVMTVAFECNHLGLSIKNFCILATLWESDALLSKAIDRAIRESDPSTLFEAFVGQSGVSDNPLAELQSISDDQLRELCLRLSSKGELTDLGPKGGLCLYASDMRWKGLEFPLRVTDDKKVLQNDPEQDVFELKDPRQQKPPRWPRVVKYPKWILGVWKTLVNQCKKLF